MKIQSVISFLACLLLSLLSVPAIACPPPDCGDCKEWDEVTQQCEWKYGAECETSGDCPTCEHCIDCKCECIAECGCGGKSCYYGYPSCCFCLFCMCVETPCSGECETCVACVCDDDQSKCDFPPNECWSCIDGSCQSDQSKCTGECETCVESTCLDDDDKCDTENCEECTAGSCANKCSPSEPYCCDGECSSLCWKTSTTPASIQQSCPDCKNIALDHCPGEYKETIEHERCSIAPTGQSGRCECYETEGVVGYTYECVVYPNANWCLCPMLKKMCKAVCGLCVPEPGPIGEIACGVCIGIYLAECITPCSYVWKCDKGESTQQPIYGDKFSHFAGDECG